MRDAHVVGDHVEYLAQVMLPQRRAELLVPQRAAKFGVHALMIEHIVTVRAAGRGLKIRRAISMTDSERFQIRRNLCRFAKSEARRELQTVRAARREGRSIGHGWMCVGVASGLGVWWSECLVRKTPTTWHLGTKTRRHLDTQSTTNHLLVTK